MRAKIEISAVLTAAGLLLGFGRPAAAQSSDGFHFTVDSLVVGWESVDVDTNSAKFNEYRDYDDGLLIEAIDLGGFWGEGDRNFAFRATRAGRDDARYDFGWRSEGSYDVEASWNRIPHRFGNDAHTLFEHTSAGRWEIADSTQAALQAAIAAQYAVNRNAITFAFLDRLLTPYLAQADIRDVGLQRDRAHAAVELGKGGALGWKLSFDHEKREGSRPYGASFGFSNVTELPEPIDYRTSTGELRGEWRGDKGAVQFGGRLSKFENSVDVMVWDNPFRLTSSTDPSAYTAPGSGSIGGSALGRATLAPDNDALTLFANGRAKLGGWTLLGTASFITMEQDGDLQPYTLNGAIRGIDEHGATFDATNPSFLPQATADRKVTVTALTAKAGVKIGKPFTLDLRGRYYDYDNKSERVEFPGYVRFHGVWEDIARITVPFAYERLDLSADFGWNIAKGTRLGLVAGVRSMDRSYREISSSDETFLRAEGGWRVGGFWLHGHLEAGDRSTSDYDVEAAEASFVDPEGATNLPALRKFDEAERGYTDFLLQADVALSDVLDLAVGVSGRDEDYDKSRFGLVSDDIVRWNAELGWRIGEANNVYVFFNRLDREVYQRSRQSGATPSVNPADDWNATFDETNDIVGAGVKLAFGERVDVDASIRWSNSDGEADLTSPPGGTPNLAVGFGNYEDIELFAGVVDFSFKINERMGVGAGWRYEDYTTDSFISQGLDYYLPGSLLLNGANGDYQGDVYTLRFFLKY